MVKEKDDLKLETLDDLLDDYYLERKWSEEAEDIDSHDVHYNKMYDIVEEITRRCEKEE